MELGTSKRGESLIAYLVDSSLREERGGERYREEQRACYDTLVHAMAEWGKTNGIARVMLGLSGGLDSALVAEVAVRALGAKNVLTVFMPSEYTSVASSEDAHALSENLGVEMLTMPIDGLRREAAKLVEASRVGGEDGLWAENVQARLRAVLLMAVSNRRGHVLLNTSNRSEILVGYSTLYGDTCGAVSVLGDLYKREVTSLAKYVNAQEQKPLIPERIISRPPSAELHANQKDEDSLPRYEELDCLLAELMGEVTRSSVFSVGYSLEAVGKMRRDVVLRAERNAFKRDQMALPLRVYGRRMPARGELQGKL